MNEVFRLNAGAVVFNRFHRILLCERADIPGSWQFPQGGIEEGETPAQAATRELFEETSIKSVIRVKTLSTPARYRFPPQVLKSMRERGFMNSGQDIYWSLFFFDGDEAEINLRTQTPEFCRYKWATLQEALDLIVDFKKDVYQVAVNEFSHIVESDFNSLSI